MRRCWWVLVSFSQVWPLRWPMLFSSVSTPAARSRWRHRIAHSSPRQNPVTMVSQIRMAQSGSFHASVRMRAASVLTSSQLARNAGRIVAQQWRLSADCAARRPGSPAGAWPSALRHGQWAQAGWSPADSGARQCQRVGSRVRDRSALLGSSSMLPRGRLARGTDGAAMARTVVALASQVIPRDRSSSHPGTVFLGERWSRLGESNPGPAHYE